MILERWRRGRSEQEVAAGLYESLVAQSRCAGFYRDFQVPDSLDGRFEVIALHVFLVLHRLKADNPATQKLAQALHDHFFADMDRCLREMGAGDLGVGKRVKRMAEALYGRIPAYESALTDDQAARQALRRNLFGTLATVEDRSLQAMAGYLRAQVTALAAQETSALQAGQVTFLPLQDSLPGQLGGDA